MRAFRLVAPILFLAGCSHSDPEPSGPAPKVDVDPTDSVKSGRRPGSIDPATSATDRALQMFREGQIDESIAVLERHLETASDDALAKATLSQFLQVKAQPATKEGRWDLAGPLLLESARLAREVRSVKGLRIDTEGLYVAATYNEACVHSRAGETDKALDSLEESLRAGFLDQPVSDGPTPRELLVSDPDLDPVRDTDRYRELKGRYLKDEKPGLPPSHDPPTG